MAKSRSLGPGHQINRGRNFSGLGKNVNWLNYFVK